MSSLDSSMKERLVGKLTTVYSSDVYGHATDLRNMLLDIKRSKSLRDF